MNDLSAPTSSETTQRKHGGWKAIPFILGIYFSIIIFPFQAQAEPEFSLGGRKRTEWIAIQNHETKKM